VWRVRVAVPGYELDDDPARVDVDAAWAFLSTEAYWGRWRTRDVLAAQIASAWRVVGVYAGAGDGAGDMVGFARAFSDGAATAYLADVYVLRGHRGHGLASALLRLMIDDGPGADFRWMLHTTDAHGLYAKAGFGPPNESYLERPGAPSRAPLPPGA
jgi:GNAT superfamily N-acetyltransferase